MAANPQLLKTRNVRRGTFYCSLKQILPAHEITNDNEDSRTFSALHGRKYTGPEIKEPTNDKSKISKNRSPIFLDTEGNIYDIDYITIDDYERKYLKSSSSSSSYRTFNPDKEVYKTLPEPKNYTSYSEYNQNLSQWYSKMQSHLGSVILPNVTGRHYLRPRIDFFENNESEKSDTTGSAKESPTPLRMIENDDIELDTDFINESIESWETYLYPPEPEPEMYATFEEYEKAMQNWAYICNKQMKVIPPHPSQFSNLILLQTAAERKALEREKEVKAKQLQPLDNTKTTSQSNSLESEDDILKNMKFENYKQDPEDKFIKRMNKLTDYSFKYDEFERCFIDDDDGTINNKFQNAFEDILINYDIAKAESGLHMGTRIVLPTSRSNLQLLPLISSPFTSEESVPSPCLSLPLGHASSRSKIELLYRPYSIKSLQCNELLKNQEYKKNTINLIKQMDYSGRYDEFFSYYKEHYTPIPSNWELDDSDIMKSILNLLLGNEKIDEFDSFLKSTSKSNNMTNLEYFVPFINDDKLPVLISFYSKLESKLAKVKLAYLFREYINCEDVKEAFEYLLEKPNTFILYELALIVNELNLIPFDIYPLFYSTYPLLKQNVNSKDQEDSVDYLLASYYIHLIEFSVNADDKYQPIRDIISQTVKKIEENVSNSLLKQKEFIIIKLPSLLKHKSKMISQLCTVLLIHILDYYTKGPTGDIFAKDGIHFMTNIRNMCSSKFSHVRYLGKRILLKIIENEKHKEIFVREFYRGAPHLLIDDIFAKIFNGSKVSFLSDFLLQYVSTELDYIIKNGMSASTISRFNFLLKGSRRDAIYHKVFQIINEANTLNDPTYLNAAKYMFKLLDSYKKMDALEGYENASACAKSMSQEKCLLVVPGDIMNILLLIQSPCKSQYENEVYAYLLKCVNILQKDSLLFDNIVKQKPFHANLLRFCRDGKFSQYNKEAWKLFFNCFKSHHGTLQFWEAAGNVLNQYMELISPGVGNIVTNNCLHYTCKILELVDRETIKLQIEGKNSRGGEDIKLIERDVKQFVVTLIKHCLKVHLIYKRLQFNNLNGTAFISVTKFYNQVYLNKHKQNINGNKLYKEFTRNKENKQTFLEVINMFGDTKNQNIARSSSFVLSPVTRTHSMKGQ